MKISTIHPRDIIAVVVLIGAGWLIYKGIDSFVTALVSLIVGYYFSKRVFEERQVQSNTATGG